MGGATAEGLVEGTGEGGAQRLPGHALPETPVAVP